MEKEIGFGCIAESAKREVVKTSMVLHDIQEKYAATTGMSIYATGLDNVHKGS